VLRPAIVLSVQVWNLTNCKLRHNLAGHTGYINTVTVSPDGSLCASGGKVRLLPLNLVKPYLYSFVCKVPAYRLLGKSTQLHAAGVCSTNAH